MIAIDSSVLIDVLTSDRQFGAASAQALAQALAEDDVVVCDAVVAEVHTLLEDSTETMPMLAQLGVRFAATSEAAAVRAGVMQRRFRDRGGRRDRVVADFLIGAHALLQCRALVTRDAGFFRDYFKGLEVIAPRLT